MPMVSWSALAEEDLIQDKRGVLYRVVIVGVGGRFVIKNVETDEQHTIERRSGEVNRILSRSEALRRAHELARTMLGAKMPHTLVEREGGPAYCPVEYGHPGAFMAHIYMMHGVEPGVESMAELKERHTSLHSPHAKSHRYVPHEHDPQYRQRAKALIGE